VAFPTIPTTGAGQIIVLTQANTTATRTFPNLNTLTSPSGDLLIAIVWAYQTSTGTNAAFSSWTAGWTEFHDSATSTTVAIGAAYKWSTGSETGQITVTQAATITGDAVMMIMSIPGAHASTPPEAGGRASSTNAVADPGAVTPSWGSDDDLFIAVAGVGRTGTGGFGGVGATPPTNYSNLASTGISTSATTGAMEGAVAFRQLTGTTDDPGTFSAGDTTNTRYGALTIAVRPAPFVIPTTAFLVPQGVPRPREQMAFYR